jgi:hypothetical protein
MAKCLPVVQRDYWLSSPLGHRFLSQVAYLCWLDVKRSLAYHVLGMTVNCLQPHRFLVQMTLAVDGPLNKQQTNNPNVWYHISLPTHVPLRFNLPTKISLHWICSVISSRQRHSCHQSADTHWPLPSQPLCSLRYHRPHHPPPTPWNLVWNHQHCPKLVSVIHFRPYFFSRHWRLKIHTSPNHL